jgi:hypothetical protein
MNAILYYCASCVKGFFSLASNVQGKTYFASGVNEQSPLLCKKGTRWNPLLPSLSSNIPQIAPVFVSKRYWSSLIREICPKTNRPLGDSSVCPSSKDFENANDGMMSRAKRSDFIPTSNFSPTEVCL